MHKTRIYFLIIIAIITCAIGIFFLKNIPLLSFIFFLSTIANIFFAFRENKMETLLKENSKIYSNVNEIQIKTYKSINAITILTCSIFIIISTFFLYLVLKKGIDIFFSLVAIMPITVIIFFVFMIYKEIKKMNSTIITINSKGIQILKKPFMNWYDIENERIISRFYTFKESKHDNSSEVNHLLFYYKNERIEIAIDELDITDSQLNQHLKIFRTRFNDEKSRLQQL